MNKLKTAAEQQAALNLVAVEAGKRVANCWLVPAGADVAYLMAADAPKAHQIVFVDGAYDIWNHTGNELIEPDVSLERAIEIVVRDYKTAKTTRVVQRILEKHKEADVAKVVEYVAREVFDDDKERTRSEQAEAKMSPKELEAYLREFVEKSP